MDFLDRLEYLIKKTGLSKKDFAKKCGVSRTQLFRYLKGDQEPGTFFYRNLKKNFPFADLGWLIAGISDYKDNVQPQQKNPEKILYDNVINKLSKLDKFSRNEINEVDKFLEFRLYKAKKDKNE